MSTGTRPSHVIPRDDVPVDRLYRLSADQYRRMAEAGILTAEDGVELLDGVIRVRNPSPGQRSGSLHRMSVDQYHEMARAGILDEDDRVELLEGRLVAKMPKNPPHTIATGLVQDELTRVVPDGWYVAVQEPVSTPASEPEPDAMIVRGNRRDYHEQQPGPSRVPLIVEVSASTLAYDRTVKREIYGRAGVAEYWIVNLVDRQVEIHTDPDEAAGYGSLQVRGPDAELSIVLDGLEVGRVAVRDILP